MWDIVFHTIVTELEVNGRLHPFVLFQIKGCLVSAFPFCISGFFTEKKKKNCCQGIFCCSSCYNGSQNNSGWSPLQSPAKSWLSYEIRLGCLGIYSLRSWKYLRIFYVGYSSGQFMGNIWKFLSCTHIQWLLWL